MWGLTRGQRGNWQMLMPVISRFLEGERVSTRGKCADSTKSWSSSWGSSDTAARARWARVCHAQPLWLLWLRLPRTGPAPEDSPPGVQAAPSPGNSALPPQVSPPALSTPLLPTLASPPASSEPGASAAVHPRNYCPGRNRGATWSWSCRPASRSWSVQACGSGR